MSKVTFTKSIIQVLMIFCFSNAKAQDVLLLHDGSSNPNNISLANALSTAGFNVVFTSFGETNWNNANPSLDNFEAVIHMNGACCPADMTTIGQLAIHDFVQNNNGLYIGFESNGYEVDFFGYMQNMIDLVLFNGTGVNAIIPRRLDVVPEQSEHPIMTGVTVPFSVVGSSEEGGIRSFDSNPSTVIMTHNGDDAVAIRDFGTGHVLGFSIVPNFNPNSNLLSSPEVQRIIINFINGYYVTNTLGVEDFTTKSKFYIFPNPSNDFINVLGVENKIDYRMFNLLGSEISNGSISENDNINIQNLAGGIYLLKFDNGNTLKFIKE